MTTMIKNILQKIFNEKLKNDMFFYRGHSFLLAYRSYISWTDRIIRFFLNCTTFAGSGQQTVSANTYHYFHFLFAEIGLFMSILIYTLTMCTLSYFKPLCLTFKYRKIYKTLPFCKGGIEM